MNEKKPKKGHQRDDDDGGVSCPGWYLQEHSLWNNKWRSHTLELKGKLKSFEIDLQDYQVSLMENWELSSAHFQII